VKGQDKIDLSLIDANTTLAGNQAFSFVGVKPFFGSAGDLYVTNTMAGALVEGDVNGDGVADFRVLVMGVTGMTAADFIL